MTIHGLELSGVSLVAGQIPERRGAEFRGINPVSGSPLDPLYYSATDADIENAAESATSAFGVFFGLSGKRRADVAAQNCRETCRARQLHRRPS